jgi:hypothetical protein
MPRSTATWRRDQILGQCVRSIQLVLRWAPEPLSRSEIWSRIPRYSLRTIERAIVRLLLAGRIECTLLTTKFVGPLGTVERPTRHYRLTRESPAAHAEAPGPSDPRDRAAHVLAVRDRDARALAAMERAASRSDPDDRERRAIEARIELARRGKGVR